MRDLREGLGQGICFRTPKDNVYPKLALTKIWVASDFEPCVTGLNIGKAGSDRPFRQFRRNRPRHDRRPPDEAIAQAFNHRLQHKWRARQYEDVLHLKARRRADGVGNKLGPRGHCRHAQAGHVQALRPIMGLEDRHGFRILYQGAIKRAGNRRRRDVVMGRADAARRKHIGIDRPAGVYGGNDSFLFVRDHPHFGEAQAPGVQLLAEIRDVFVARPSGKNFVADNKQGGGWRRGWGHNLQGYFIPMALAMFR